ncbi:MAG: hypothetical protein HFI97_01025 [Lachnospiraceae bacterium]|jgi:Flp pilus assembly pilin Flp|nr:hypothetical protein [Lachnospiraceae bacterium]MCI9202275.1 hypothetical protein [Lachnospiraceae bacterium]
MRTFLQIKKLQAEQILRKKLEELLSEEGDTNFVSIILIMVIVIAIAAIFSEQLKGAVDAVFGQLTEFIENKGQKY